MGKAGAQHAACFSPRPGRQPLCAGKEVTPVPASCSAGHEPTSFPTGFAPSFQGMVRGRRAGAGSSQGARETAARAPGSSALTPPHPSVLRAEGLASSLRRLIRRGSPFTGDGGGPGRDAGSALPGRCPWRAEGSEPSEPMLAAGLRPATPHPGPLPRDITGGVAKGRGPCSHLVAPPSLPVILFTVIPRDPQRIGSRTPMDAKILRCSTLL